MAVDLRVSIMFTVIPTHFKYHL